MPETSTAINPKKSKSKPFEVPKKPNDCKTMRQQVAFILDKFPEARDNDALLLMKWLLIFGGIPVPCLKYEHLQSIAPKIEAIFRLRRKIQHDNNMLKPFVPFVAERREQISKKMREKKSNVN